ncbi:MAG: autotransporter domain-containing protein [Phascolarctobacterium sp.]|nr:autotransporter domain-containing protein [Phascolarctobacterium sp.]
MLNKKRTLTTAVLLVCSCILSPYYAHAEEEIPDCGHAKTYMTVTAGDLSYKFDLYSAAAHPGQHWRGEYKQDDDGNDILDEDGNRIKEYVTYRDLFTGEVEAFANSIGYIHKLINPTNALVPTLQLDLLPDQDANASATSEACVKTDSNGKPLFQISSTELGAVLLGQYEPEANEAVSHIEINMSNPNANWYIDKFPVLPANGLDSDYYGTVTHEMFHALGLVAEVSQSVSDITDDAEPRVNIGKDVNYDNGSLMLSMKVFNKYEMGLRDVFGRVVYYEAVKEDIYNPIYNYYDGGSGEQQPLNPNAENITLDGELVSRNIVGITVDEYNNLLNNKELIDSQAFYILKDATLNQNGGVYFAGKHVEEVLTTKDSNGVEQVAKIAWPDDSTAPAVPGLPVNCYEDFSDPKPELSHIELQNGLMSHQNYRNWCSFMEAELALMQDLGYDIDRSKYFGKSIYNSGEKDEDGSIDYFTYTNNKAFDSTTVHGIGLHVYGSYVDVTQTGELNANGYSGIGIRVDGVGNKLEINSNITANGDYGNGLLVTYGKEHEITLNANKTIEAIGTDGVAARFDFGSNELGDQIEYRGSYIATRYVSQEELDEREAEKPGSTEGEVVGWKEIFQTALPEAINGELVSNFEVNGTLKGKLASIYISPNAYVKNININDGATLEGDIISLWNPNAIIYQNEEGDTIAPALPEGENGLTNLNFIGEHSFSNKILGQDSIVLNIGQAATSTASIMTLSDSTGMSSSDIGSGSSVTPVINNTLTTTDFVNVKEVNIANGSTYNNQGILTADSGAGNINIEGTLNNENGRLFSRVNDDGALLNINGNGTLNLTNSQIQLGMMHDFYDGNVILRANWANTLNIVGTPKINLFEQSPTLDFEGALDPATHEYTIKMRRNYEQFAYDKGTTSLAKALQQNAAYLGNESAHAAAWQEIYEGIDFSKADGSQVTGALKQLNPSVYTSSAQVTLNTHSLLNSMNMLCSFSNNIPAARTGGGRGPAAQAVTAPAGDASAVAAKAELMLSEPQHNAWRNVVVPFSAYTDQHSGMRGYTNHNSGVIGAMERTLASGLTHGYHAAVNHQSTSEGSSRIKGEGLYLGAQASYAPAAWQGWQAFASARIGVEQMRSHRSVTLPGSISGSANADWTGYSGSLSVGTALTKEHGVLQSGPFAALDYSFAHRPSVNESGDIINTRLASETYDSLRAQLGYRLATKPKALDSYDSTQWQAHASVAWNHELLSDNGSTSYTLADLPGYTITDAAENYGRDSMSIAAGVTFKTPKRLDVGLTLGSDIYRKGGSSVYGKVNMEWKF